MALVSLVGIDQAGGVINGPGAPGWTWNGAPISVVGDGVTGHGAGAHAGPAMATGSAWMSINGIPVVRAGDVATCTHQATGSSQMDID